MKYVRLPNASTLGYLKRRAQRGDIVTWRYPGESGAERIGRVVDAVTHDGIGNPYPNRRLLVLMLALGGSMAHLCHVDPDLVSTCRAPDADAAFVAWFFSGPMPSAAEVKKSADAGALTARYFRESTDGNGAWVTFSNRKAKR